MTPRYQEKNDSVVLCRSCWTRKKLRQNLKVDETSNVHLHSVQNHFKSPIFPFFPNKSIKINCYNGKELNHQINLVNMKEMNHHRWGGGINSKPFLLGAAETSCDSRTMSNSYFKKLVLKADPKIAKILIACLSLLTHELKNSCLDQYFYTNLFSFSISLTVFPKHKILKKLLDFFERQKLIGYEIIVRLAHLFSF